MAEKIPLEAIVSSNLQAIGYNPEKRILAIQFKHGGDIYHYADVTPEKAAEFYGAESRGRYYALNIKGKLPGSKMTGTCPQCGDRPGWVGDTCESCGTAAYAETPKKAEQ